MLKIILYLFLLLCSLPSSGLAQRKSTLYLQGQFNHTLYDATKGNNPWGLGAAFQLFINPEAKLRPTAELSGDLYLADEKVQRQRDLVFYPDKQDSESNHPWGFS